ncbi:MAG TPA: nuclear transport factor 2 family protein [Anaerolineae bacterium]|nr:nuclear transport factor 2 family protein [Anaerolineae bacterium]
MSQPIGKGFFIWKIPNCEDGDPDAIAYTAYKAGLSHILIKIANGIYDYNYANRKDLVAPVANALHAKGIQVWGWHYVFGDLPKDEARAAIRQIKKLPIDGYVIDAESQYKDKYTPCRIFMGELRSSLPDFPIALSSYRYPKYHPQLPWKDFLIKCDYNMPQVYWEQAHNPNNHLKRSLREFQTITPFKPYIPTGAAYGASGWKPTTQDIIEFMNTAIELNFPAVNFWSWDYCRLKLPNIWQTIASFSWPNRPNPPKNIPEILIDALNSHSLEKILQLYATDAVHVNAKRTIQGTDAIKTWYLNFINDHFPNTTFTISSISGKETTYHFSWEVKTNNNMIYSGEDTLGLSKSKIIYHFTSYFK